jgi:hypothetical protein
MQLLGTTRVGLLLGLLSFGCGAGGAGNGKGGGPVFPSRADLSEIMARPQAKGPGQERATLAVDDWQPEQPPAATTEAELIVERAADAKGRKLANSPELGCAAREVARFHAKHQAFPDQQLQAHMAGVGTRASSSNWQSRCRRG